MKYSKNKIITIILFLLCIFISLGLSQIPFVIHTFRNSSYNKNLEGFGNKYMDDLSDQLGKIEDIIQSGIDASGNKLTDKEKLENVTKLVSEIPDSDKYSYKTDLDTILKNNNSDPKVIFKAIMDKIKEMRITIVSDLMSDQKSNITESSKDPRIATI